ncbi:ABC transporter permease [Streptomyces sp. NPDC050560]|uniref:ABC transporter permease n=1 Tax=Streptomyces sp. NPDC050560 TaxID=3365630 RepID=UPI003796DBB7
MKALRAMTLVEIKLFLRDPYTALTSILLPTVLLIAFGLIPGTSKADDQYGGLRFIDYWAPSMIVITVSVLALQALPTYVATYREKGVLRRMSTTPVHPTRLLAAQLITQFAAAVVALALMLVVGSVGFDVKMPQHPAEFALAYLLGIVALLTLGLLVSSIAPSGRAAYGIGLLLFFPTMFFGGVYVPRSILPSGIADIGNYFPPSVQALQDSWTGSGVQPLHLAVMAVFIVAIGALAGKVFRWS